MKVLFIANGLGLGNSTRIHAVIEYLHLLGAETRVATSNNGLWYFAQVSEVSHVYAIESFHYGARGAAIDIGKTVGLLPEFAKVMRKNSEHIENILETWAPDIVVTDSEYAFFPIKKYDRPLIALNNADVVARFVGASSDRPWSILPQFFAVEVLDYVFHRIVPDLVISPQLIPTASETPDQLVHVGPIVRRRFEGDGEQPKDVRALVMLSGSNFASRLPLDGEVLPFPVDVAGGREFTSKTPAQVVRSHGRIHDTSSLIRGASLVVVNGGFSAVSEAFYCRKPTLVLPIPRHAEQWVNAKTIEKLGVGLVCDETNFREKLMELFARRDEFAKAYRDLKIENGASQAADLIFHYQRAKAKNPLSSKFWKSLP